MSIKNFKKQRYPAEGKTTGKSAPIKKTLEQAAVLSLSLILTSTFSVSSVLPEMKQHFITWPQAMVESVISITSFAIMLTVLADIQLRKIISEKQSIITGLIMIALFGTFPVWCNSFPLIFFSRIMLGMGIGLVNSYAITIIQNRCSGSEQAFLLGLRGSMETLGSAFLTLLAGRLLLKGWNRAFLIYLSSLAILILYLLFAAHPSSDTKEEKTEERKAVPITGKEKALLMKSAFLAGLFICINVSNNMRLPDLVINKGIGNAKTASYLLSIIQAAGMIGGIFYGGIKAKLKKSLFPFTILCYCFGEVIFLLAGNLPLMVTGSLLSGYGNGLLTTILFNDLSETLPKDKVQTGTHIVLIGCNLGGSMAPVVMKLIALIKDGNSFLLSFYSALLMILAVMEFLVKPKTDAC